MDTELLRLLPQEETAFSDEVNVPSAGGMDTGCEYSGALDVADTNGAILVVSA